MFKFFEHYKYAAHLKFFPRVKMAFLVSLILKVFSFKFWLDEKIEHIVRDESCYKNDFSLDD